MKRARLEEVNNNVFDIIIIGGGITGAAIARDAALRGLKCILLEKEDFASGTSSRSSKLIHGGLRYLETLEFGLVAESVKERELALKMAPHLTKVESFMYMFYDNYPDKKWLMNLGLSFYDFVSGDWKNRRHKMLSSEDVLNIQPQFKSEGLKGAALFYDVATDDARITMDTIKSAYENGSIVMNHCEVVGLIFDDNKCNGVRVIDRITREEGVIYGNYVVNSTGPWSDTILNMEERNERVLRPTKGVHIVLDRKDFPIKNAVFMRSPDDGRVVWPVPSMEEDRVYIGTTDSTFEGDLNDVYPDRRDVKYLLNVANSLMPKNKLTEEHIIGSWAGLRPLIAPGSEKNNSKISREHQILQSKNGLFSIIGGKLTSHRIMAKHLLDAIIEKDRGSLLKHSLAVYKYDTSPISGGIDERGGKFNKTAIVNELKAMGIDIALAERWVKRYGCNALKVLKYWMRNDLNKKILSKRLLTVAEVHYCVSEESTFTINDLMIRRTSSFFWEKDGGMTELNIIADEMQKLLGWSDEIKEDQMKAYEIVVKKHRWEV